MKRIQRTFIPGSEWLYLKIYGGEKNLDKLLGNEIYSIVNKLDKESRIDKWFFIRYADPDTHLRIRFLLKERKDIAYILDLFYTRLNPLTTNNVIWKIQIDTYVRELERYGSHLIEEAESIFKTDSECIISCIRLLNTISNEDYRWMISLRMIDSLLTDFSYSNVMKKKFMEQLSSSFKKEFNFNEFNSKQFNDKYREHKNAIENIMKDKLDDKLFLQLLMHIKQRSPKNAPIIKVLYKKSKHKNNTQIIAPLLQSYIHMMINRLFRSKNRIHELVIYDLMRRYYVSEEAKIKYNKV